MLLLSGNGAARRKCRVMWRKPRQLGVKFERHLSAGERATLVPKLDTGMDTAITEAEPAESV